VGSRSSAARTVPCANSPWCAPPPAFHLRRPIAPAFTVGLRTARACLSFAGCCAGRVRRGSVPSSAARSPSNLWAESRCGAGARALPSSTGGTAQRQWHAFARVLGQPHLHLGRASGSDGESAQSWRRGGGQVRRSQMSTTLAVTGRRAEGRRRSKEWVVVGAVTSRSHAARMQASPSTLRWLARTTTSSRPSVVVVYCGSVWSRKWSGSRRAGLSQLSGATWQADFVFAVVSARRGSCGIENAAALNTAFVQPRCVLGGNIARLIIRILDSCSSLGDDAANAVESNGQAPTLWHA
jgi:hypothetical protein